MVDTPALVAFHHMSMDHKSAVGVLDNTGKLVSAALDDFSSDDRAV